ncbi:MAG: TAXI family TRAP transporter solute-binding subunit [Bilophila wadsworthia]
MSSITYEALNGERGFKDRAYKDVRVLAGLYYNPNQVVARADSGVASLADFKGKSFAPGAAGGTTEWNHPLHRNGAQVSRRHQSPFRGLHRIHRPDAQQAA